MPKPDNVIRLRLPNTAAQADRLKRLVQKNKPIDIAVTVLPGSDGFQVQRAWRFLFGLYQDCACIRWSKGFKKTPGVAFVGKMDPARLVLFLKEAMPYVAAGRAQVHVKGERLRRHLMDVMAA